MDDNLATAPEPVSPIMPVPPACICCGEPASPDRQLLKPCRVEDCGLDYCLACLVEMFTGATKDSSRFPPRCCSLIQIHTVLPGLTELQAREYRQKFDERTTTHKVYCPSPTCSAFIPQRYLPPINPSSQATLTMQSVLSDIVQKVTRHPEAHHLRTQPDITQQPGCSAVSRHIDLKEIQANVEASRYLSPRQLTQDILLIVSNAKTLYHGEGGPVAKTAEQFLQCYLQTLSAAMEHLLRAAAASPQASMLACPRCHIGICAKCKQIEHGTSVCDTTVGDHETAMLAQLGCKRCPSCGHAVRRMYGCSHMQCVCGAHWCYRCQQSTNICDGDCNDEDSNGECREDHDHDAFCGVYLPDDDSTDDDGVDAEDAEDAKDAGDAEDAQDTQDSTAGPSSTTTNSGRNDAAPPVDDGEGPRSHQRVEATVNTHRFVDLDAGGSSRWEYRDDLDFGGDPEEVEYTQVWSCTHNFSPYIAPKDHYDHGDLTRMECNSCFEHVTLAPAAPRKPAHASSKKHKSRKNSDSGTSLRITANDPQAEVPPKQAWECKHCNLVVCTICRVRYYPASQPSGEDDPSNEDDS